MKHTLEQINTRPTHRSCLLIGPPKTGKTQSLATMLARDRPIWYFNFDGGDAAEPLVRHARLQKWGPRDFVEFTYGNVGNRLGLTEKRPRGRECFLDMAKDINALFDFVDPSTGEWKANSPEVPGTIVIDSITSYQAVIMDFVLAMGNHNLGDKGFDGRNDYGMAMGKIEETVETIKSLPVNFVAICHELLLKDELIGQIMLLPNVFGQNTLAPQIGRHFGAVIYAKVEAGKYIWITQPEGFIKSAGIRALEGVPAKVPQDFAAIWK